MNAHSDKTSENKTQAVADSLTKLQNTGKSSFEFVDNRPEAVAQRRLHEAVDNSLQVQQLRAYLAMADNFIPQIAQRKENLEEEKLQGRPELIQKKENNTGLPDDLKTGIENLSGYSMDDVKVHFNSDKPAQLQAHAYAQGTDIHLASGQEKHLPHEAWHVVQQKQGRVKPTLQMKGKVNVNDDEGLENEADVMGAKAMQMKLNKKENSSFCNSVAQKKSNAMQGFEFVDNRPEAVAQRKLQTIANDFVGQAIQRYTVEDNPSGKRSTNHLIFVDDTNSLYATDEKVEEANQVVEASPISFESDNENQIFDLSKVVVTRDEPAVEEEIEPGEHNEAVVGDQEEAEDGGEVIIGHEQITEASEYVNSLLDGNLESLQGLQESYEQQSGTMKMALGEEFKFAFEEFHEKGVELVLRPALERFRDYLAAVGGSDKILLPSDCGLFAGMIMNIQEKEVVDEENESYVIGLKEPDERVTAVGGGVAIPGQAYYVKGETDEDKGVVFHWGATIMSDANDTVTMEGAVGLHSDFPKLENDNTWKFEMYGTAEGEDTFATLNAHYFQNAEITESDVYGRTPE